MVAPLLAVEQVKRIWRCSARFKKRERRELSHDAECRTDPPARGVAERRLKGRCYQMIIGAISAMRDSPTGLFGDHHIHVILSLSLLTVTISKTEAARRSRTRQLCRSRANSGRPRDFVMKSDERTLGPQEIHSARLSIRR
jgi:hypothetical protein